MRVHCGGNLSRTVPNRHGDQEPQRAPAIIGPYQTKVAVIGDAKVSTKVLKFLSLGSSFSIMQVICAGTFPRVIGGLRRLRDQLRARAREDSEGGVIDGLSCTTLSRFRFQGHSIRSPKLFQSSMSDSEFCRQTNYMFSTCICVTEQRK